MKSKYNPFLALASLATALTTLSASAGTQYKWVGTTDTAWATSTNWDANGVAPTGVSSTNRLSVSNTTANSATYNFPGTTTTYAADVAAGSRGLVIGSGSNGSMVINGGTFSTLGAVSQDILGNGNGNTGTLTIDGTATLPLAGDAHYIGTNLNTDMGLGFGSFAELSIKNGSATVAELRTNNTTATINLETGGTLAMNKLTYLGGGNNIFNFNGGTLKARSSSAAFIATPTNGVTTINVKSGGAIIDTNTFDITITRPLLEDAVSTGGGLTKNGAGLLTLGGTNTLTGDVTVNAGGLGVKSGLDSWYPSSLSHSGDTLNFDLGVYDSFNPAAINTLTLTVDSPITVNVTGTSLKVGEIPLIEYGSKDFTGGSLTLNTASLPPNVVATLEDDGSGLIYLDVTAAPSTYVWSGDSETPGTGDWDTTSSNWNDFSDTYSTSGSQVVTFPDIAVANPGDSNTVTISGDYSPVNFAINNTSGNPYSFEGTGKITGATGITKTGTGMVGFNGGAHTYSGDVAINTGAIIKQASDATTGNITVANNATFALDGGVTTGADQTITVSGPGATGGSYFYPGSAVQRGALQGQNGDNTWNGNVILNTTTNTRIGVQDDASLTIGGTITESAAGAAPTFRAGNLGDDITLNGACSWTGDTYMYSTGASIVLGDNDRLPTNTRIVFTGSATVFDLNGHNQQLRGMTSYNPTVINDGDTPSILTLSPAIAETIAYYGVIIDGLETISLVKSGDGTISLNGTNTYSGDTTVNSGTLLINSPGVLDAASAVTVNGGILGGTGTINGPITVGALGTLAPGVSTDDLYVGSVDFSAGGTLAIEINDAAAVKADLLVATDTIDVTNAKLVISATGIPAEESYVIATGAITGTIDPEDVTGLPAGYTLVQTESEIRLDQVTGGYASWATDNSITEGENGDDDKDGIINLVEYALGLDPQASSTPAGTFSANTLTFTKGAEAKAAGDVTYSIEISTTLLEGSWSPAAATEDADSISFQLSGPGKLFARLKVTKP
jgi:fibronectin-binding autotransporter adhesin